MFSRDAPDVHRYFSRVSECNLILVEKKVSKKENGLIVPYIPLVINI